MDRKTGQPRHYRQRRGLTQPEQKCWLLVAALNQKTSMQTLQSLQIDTKLPIDSLEDKSPTILKPSFGVLPWGKWKRRTDPYLKIANQLARSAAQGLGQVVGELQNPAYKCKKIRSLIGMRELWMNGNKYG